MHARPDPDERSRELPVESITEACGLYFRSLRMKDAGMVAQQHTHDHDHATLVASGRARGWSGELWVGDKGPGEAFEIRAGVDHMFQALAPETLLVCVHDIASAESVKRRVSFHSAG